MNEISTIHQEFTDNKGNHLLNMMTSFDKFADYIINSDYRKSFEKTVKSDDGKSIVVVDKSDIVSCMMLGHELGISPMGSIALGRKLNAKSYFSVKRGESLGLDPITSISKIYNISTQNGDVVSLAVDIISKAMIDAKCEIQIINDYKLVPKFYILDAQYRQYVGHLFNILDPTGKISSDYFIVSKTTTKDELSDALDNNKILIQQQGYTYVTSIRGIRPSKKLDITIHYSLQEAIDAGLYKGFHSTDVDQTGKPIYIIGKSNWNSHPATMLRNRPLSILGRILVADIIQGSYSHEEVMDIVNVNSEEELTKYQSI